MEIAAFVHTHNNPELTADTVDSVKTWMTKKVFVLVDGAGWKNFDHKDVGCDLHCGLLHGRQKSPFRNILFGLKEIYKRYPDQEWYAYLENDCLVVTDQFKEDLKKAKGKWFAGCNHRTGQLDIPLLDQLVGGRVSEEHYVIGCTMFFHRDYLEKLLSENIPNKIIEATLPLPSGDFPAFRGFAFEETLFPSLSNYYRSSSVYPLSGNFTPRYPVRWPLDLLPSDVSPAATILHPVKKADDPLRLHYRRFRELIARGRNA